MKQKRLKSKGVINRIDLGQSRKGKPEAIERKGLFRFHWTLWLVPVLLAMTVNMNVLQNGYGWDDENIVPKMKTSDSWMGVFFPGSSDESKKIKGSYFRPMVSLSYRIDHKIWGARPFGFHLSVWLLHILNTGLVFLLARALAEPSPRTSPFFPFVVSSLFAVHPIHAEAIAWIAGRNDVLCTSFLLISMVFYIRFHRFRNWVWFGLSMVVFYMALLTKEAAAGMAILFALYELLAGPTPARNNPEAPPLRKRVRDLVLNWRIILPSLMIPLMVLGYYVGRRMVKIAHPVGDIAPAKLFPSSSSWDPFLALGYYLKIMVFPYPQQPFISGVPTSWIIVMLSTSVVILGVAGILYCILKRNVVVGMGFGWAVAILSPAVLVTILPLAATPVAERYVYGPSVGFTIGLVWLIMVGIKRLETAGWISFKVWAMIALVFVIILSAWGWESHKRNEVWRSPVSFWQTASATSPKAGFPHRELGLRYGHAGMPVKAEASYRRAIELDKKFWGPKHPEVAAGLLNLGVLYTDQSNYEEAETLFLEAIAIFDEKLVPNNSDIATGLLNLAGVYYLQGRYLEAEPLFERSLKVWENLLGPNHPNLLPSLKNFSMVYYLQGKFNRAKPLFERVIKIQTETLGPDHPNLAGDLFRLAEIHNKERKYLEARPLYERSLAIQEKSLDSEHPDLATTLNRLALLYYTIGNYEKSEHLYERSLAIRERIFDGEHPELAVTLNGMAGLYYAQGRFGEAEPLFKRALSIREASLGPDHTNVAQTLNNLGVLYYAKGEYAKAEALMIRSVAIREKSPGKNNPDLSTSLNSLAGLYFVVGNYKKAKPLFERSLAIREKALGKDHPDVARVLDNYALVLLKMNLRADAAQVKSRADAIRKKQLRSNPVPAGSRSE